MEEKKEKTVNILPVVIAIFIGAGIYATVIARNNPPVTNPEDQTIKYEIGVALEGLSFADIRKKYVEENEKSSLKGKEYLNSLTGEYVTWIGEIKQVGAYSNYENYLQINIDDGLFDNNTYVFFPVDSDYKNFVKGDLVKISGKIKSFNQNWPSELSLSPDFEDPIVEKIEKN